MIKKHRLGQIGLNKFGSLMEVIEYNDANNILVKFLEHGNTVHTEWRSFCKGRVRDIYSKSICGIGYIGEGKYTPWENKKETPKYRAWNNMMQRCYNFTEKRHTYKDCTVCEEWHNFQNFATWYDDNYYEIDGEKMSLDKDILVKGNKIYSPNTCVFVPQFINSIFIKSNTIRGNSPIGVHWSVHHKKFIAACKKRNQSEAYIGVYDTEEDAFQSYKFHKQKYIKEVAEEFKEKIPQKLYEAMIKYKVEIGD